MLQSCPAIGLRFTVAVLALLLPETAIPAANAAAPATTLFSFEDEYVDTYTCPGMSLDTWLEGHVVFQALTQTRVRAHQRLVYTVTANGMTFADNESFTNTTDLVPISLGLADGHNVESPAHHVRRRLHDLQQRPYLR